MDPRLQGGNLIKIAGAAGLKSGEYEVLAYAGPSLWMTKPHQPNHANGFWWLLENVSLKVHGIKKVIIVGHSSCGGFALKGVPSDPAVEKEYIISSLQSAAVAIKQKFLGLGVKLVFVTLGDVNGEGLPVIHPEIIPSAI